MRAFDLPHSLEYDSNGETKGVVFEIGRGDAENSVFAEIAVMVHPSNPHGICVSLRSPNTLQQCRLS